MGQELEGKQEEKMTNGPAAMYKINDIAVAIISDLSNY